MFRRAARCASIPSRDCVERMLAGVVFIRVNSKCAHRVRTSELGGSASGLRQAVLISKGRTLRFAAVIHTSCGLTSV
jgi:hypothetical protein